MCDVESTWVIPLFCLCSTSLADVGHTSLTRLPHPGDQLARVHGHERDVGAHGVPVPAQLGRGHHVRGPTLRQRDRLPAPGLSS